MIRAWDSNLEFGAEFFNSFQAKKMTHQISIRAYSNATDGSSLRYIRLVLVYDQLLTF